MAQKHFKQFKSFRLAHKRFFKHWTQHWIIFHLRLDLWAKKNQTPFLTDKQLCCTAFDAKLCKIPCVSNIKQMRFDFVANPIHFHFIFTPLPLYTFKSLLPRNLNRSQLFTLICTGTPQQHLFLKTNVSGIPTIRNTIICMHTQAWIFSTAFFTWAASTMTFI